MPIFVTSYLKTYSRLLPLPLLLAVSLFALSGCTSISRSQYGQFIHVNPKLNQRTVRVEIDGEVKGEAPGYFEVSRGRKPRITLLEGESSREVTLETRYRWSRSFFSGLVFFAYAPVAWMIDLVTGTAWDVQDFRELGAPLPNADRFRVAIAPPKAGALEISDFGGDWLAGDLASRATVVDFPGYRGTPIVKPYRETLTKFLDNDYRFDVSEGDFGESRKLYNEIGAEVILESTIDEKRDKFVLTSTALNTVTGEKRPGPSLTFQESELSRKLPGVGVKLRNSWLTRLIPNTIGVDLVSESLKVDLASTGLSYELTRVKSDDWLSTGISYISSLNFSSSPDRRREFSSRWEFSPVPVVRFSRKHVTAASLPIPNSVIVESEPDFVRWLVSVGYGLQIGYLNGRHYFYLDIIPTYVWSEIYWRQLGSDRSATEIGFSSQSELGYTFNWSTHWYLKLFSRSQFEPTNVWRDALSSRLGSRQVPIGASTLQSGITFAYQFDSYEFESPRSRK